VRSRNSAIRSPRRLAASSGEHGTSTARASGSEKRTRRAGGSFVIGSEGYFDDFVVEGVPDMDWVQKRWRAIISGL